MPSNPPPLDWVPRSGSLCPLGIPFPDTVASLNTGWWAQPLPCLPNKVDIYKPSLAHQLDDACYTCYFNDLI